MESTCLWCEHPVSERGATCSFECYESFFHALRSVGGLLSEDTDTPLSLERQPWYHRMVALDEQAKD